MHEINIDEFVDYRSEYAPHVKNHHISGDTMIGLCPFHEDKKDSFSVNLKTGQWKCFAEDESGNFISFYSKLNGLSTKEAYKRILERYGRLKDYDEDNRSYTLEEYAAEKHIPAEWLQSTFRLSTDKDTKKTKFLREPYFNEHGVEATFRKRYRHKDFKWKYGSGSKICLYGEWRVGELKAANNKTVVIVEGESDTQSLWFMEIPAFGVPGASMFKEKHVETLDGFDLIIHQEPDQGGEAFVPRILEKLSQAGFTGKVQKFSCGDIPGCKDPSDILIKFGKEDGKKKILELLRQAEDLELVAPDVIPEAIPGAPVSLRQPEGWIYSEKGISKIDQKTFNPTLVCRTPIILTRRLKSLDTGDERMEVAFLRDGEWKRAIFARSTIFTSRGITALSDLGCTVTSENSRMVVKFLQALEAENIDVIEKSDSTSTFGWQAGNRFVPGRDEGIILDIDPSQRQMAAAYEKAGTMDLWIEMMRHHRARDKFRFILAASFAAPLLRIIKQRIFFVYNWGDARGGKTSGLKAALSAWGDPERLMVSFNATTVGLERTASFYCDLPLGIDERQLAGSNQDALEKIVYMIASGSGKIRGAKNGGIQTMNTWRTIALATGEESLTKSTSQTGVSTRVLEIYGGPFDDELEASRMHQEASENCGWAGPEFIGHLVQLSEASIREKYSQMREYVESIAGGKAGSHVAGISAVALADAMVDDWFFRNHIEPPGQVPLVSDEKKKALQLSEAAWERAKKMAQSILEEQMDAASADVNENAVQWIVDWVVSNEVYFGENTPGVCYGMMDRGGDTAYIFPSKLDEVLTKAGYSYRKTLKYMGRKGFIEQSVNKRNGGKSGAVNTVIKRFQGRSLRFVEFKIGLVAARKNGESAEENYMDGFEEIPESEQGELPFQ